MAASASAPGWNWDVNMIHEQILNQEHHSNSKIKQPQIYNAL